MPFIPCQLYEFLQGDVSPAKICNLIVTERKSEMGSSEQEFIGSDSYWMGLFFPSFLTFCLLWLLPLLVSFHPNSNENNNNDKNSITSISLSVITLFHAFPFLLKLYLTSSAVVRKQDYWYLSKMKVHF